jgi:hypothetical protein
MLTPAVASQLLRAELGYATATGALALALWLVYRHGTAARVARS